MTTLHIRVETGTNVFDDLQDDLAAIDRGEDVEPDEDPVLSVESVAALSRMLRETNLELLRAIAEHEPESIRATARLVDRGPAEVLENVNELADYGLVRLEQDGRAKRPVVWYDAIEIDVRIPLHGPDDGEEPALTGT